MGRIDKDEVEEEDERGRGGTASAVPTTDGLDKSIGASCSV